MCVVLFLHGKLFEVQVNHRFSGNQHQHSLPDDFSMWFVIVILILSRYYLKSNSSLHYRNAFSSQMYVNEHWILKSSIIYLSLYCTFSLYLSCTKIIFLESFIFAYFRNHEFLKILIMINFGSVWHTIFQYWHNKFHVSRLLNSFEASFSTFHIFSCHFLN